MKKKLIAMLLSAAMCLSLAACGQKADTPDTTDPAEPSGDAATYTVGICQLVQHEALDAATQGFMDALTEALRPARSSLTSRTPPAIPTTAPPSSTALSPRAWT